MQARTGKADFEMKKFLIALLALPVLAFASTEIQLDKAPDKIADEAALQNGAKLFVNYCLNCHSASYMRYNRLTGIGLSEDQIKDNLLFTADKTGELMRVAMQRVDAKVWFGAAPPDLTLVARARASESGSGPDWLYTYLRSFYRDPARPNGWNNVIFENVAMPHALWELQGVQVLGEDHKLSIATPGKMTAKEYDEAVGDLVAYLQYMAEPMGQKREVIGFFLLGLFAVLFVVVLALKREYWKDIH